MAGDAIGSRILNDGSGSRWRCLEYSRSRHGCQLGHPTERVHTYAVVDTGEIPAPFRSACDAAGPVRWLLVDVEAFFAACRLANPYPVVLSLITHMNHAQSPDLKTLHAPKRGNLVYPHSIRHVQPVM